MSYQPAPFELRTCVICKMQYMPIRNKQQACQKESCKHERKITHAREYARLKRKGLIVDHPDRECVECRTVYKPQRIDMVTCSPKCQKERERKMMKCYRANKDKVPKVETGKIRPFTSTTAMMIVSDLMRGRRPSEIAAVLNRDTKDVRRFIAEIERDGTKAKWERRLKAYQGL